MLEHDRVAGGELRRADANDLVVGEIPWLDGVENTQWFVDELDVVLAEALRGQVAWGELGLAVGDVLAQHVDANVDLRFGLGNEFAHLKGNNFRVLALLCL
ncbi:hypothetical protein CIP107567_02339 [Corynebacterium diphtheriae]|nr:hypothetical protein CIP107567_02339 [Corynebacterium diphtheriae]